jgi:CubicO group peptidase (beta-lactamase class C family)
MGGAAAVGDARRVIDALADSLDDLVPEVLRITGTPGASVAVELRGERLARAYGWADVAARRPMATATMFPGGSMTKLYTAVAALQLIERGVIGLHDPVNRHLDGIDCTNPLGARDATVHDLLTFRSGLGVDTTALGLGPPPPLAEHVARRLADLRTQEYGHTAPRWTSRVGERYHYANLGLSVLGLLVERRNPEGLPLAEYLREHVLAPLGMRCSFLTDFTGGRPEHLATGYACFDVLKVPTPWLRSADHPANGLITRPDEHLELLVALREGGRDLLSPASVRRMLTPQVSMDADPNSPGGWWTGLVAILDGERRFGQPGAHEWGWWNHSWAYPGLDCAVVVCTNGWDMMRWHNPANPAAAALIADHVGAFVADPGERRGSWAERRSRLAGAVLAERTYGLLGIEERLDDATLRELVARASASAPWDPDAFAAGLRDGAPESDPALLLDLGAAYGHPVPLWLWPSAAATAAAIAV